MSTIGLCRELIARTRSSRALFFSEPGTPCAYSGLEMTETAADPSSARSSATAGCAGSSPVSRSG